MCEITVQAVKYKPSFTSGFHKPTNPETSLSACKYYENKLQLHEGLPPSARHVA